ncbi:MAG: UDP-N-acetylmuramoylalanine--D-glutamate ligase [Actinomycetota bacterium]|jgi:UDP-N-acetylmuramoylalanine--D-glutamate ligase
MIALPELQSWHSNWKDLRVVVLGLGVSGFSVADTLHELGAKQLVFANAVEEQHRDLLEVLGIEYRIGLSDSDTTAAIDAFAPQLVIVSPGIKPTNPVVQHLDSKRIPYWGDIELAWRLRDKVKPAEWILITGTNGKTTTTQLVEHILVEQGTRAIACGNIGLPVLDAIRNPDGFDYLVVEISSFQLHYLNRIAPKVAALLNIAEDHLDWHGGFDAYIAAKAKVFEGATAAIVYNEEDARTGELAQNADVESADVLAVGFTRGVPMDLRVGYIEGSLIDRGFVPYRAKEVPELANLDDIAQIGVVTPHLLSNVAAAVAIARACDATPDAIRSAIRSFKLDRHRIEFVADLNGVLWFDDSKATNTHAADASLRAFDSVVWLVGGLLKGVDLAPLVAQHAGRIKAAIVIGVDREPVLEAFRIHAPDVAVYEVAADNDAVMAQAVAKAVSVAQPGDVVLLAPAAASMDQFKDYADRGEQFAEAVKQHA